jgi:hypothetical protein
MIDADEDIRRSGRAVKGEPEGITSDSGEYTDILRKSPAVTLSDQHSRLSSGSRGDDKERKCNNCNVPFFNSGKTVYQAKETLGMYFLPEKVCNKCKRGEL